jgi:hypothetical protein
MHANTSIWVVPTEPQQSLQIVHFQRSNCLRILLLGELDAVAYPEMPAALGYRNKLHLFPHGCTYGSHPSHPLLQATYPPCSRSFSIAAGLD